MAKRDRQRRYREIGAAADLVSVETLVPSWGREQILALAARLRRVQRERKANVEKVVARVRQLSEAQPRRYSVPIDIDRVVVTSVNVPFPRPIDAQALAGSIKANKIPEGYAGHFERFFGELALPNILRFSHRHGITAGDLALFVRKNGAKLALRRPDLEEHLNALVPNS